jgi:sulfate adenylyltransferase
MIHPHGGGLVSRVVSGGEREALADEAGGLTQVALNQRELADLEMIACGAMSPLEGFMVERDYRSVVESMRLGNGLVWSIPVVLSAKTEEQERLGAGDRAALVDEAGRALAVMEVEDC